MIHGVSAATPKSRSRVATHLRRSCGTDLALSHIDPVWDPIGAGFTVNSWRVVIGDRRSLTIGAGGFEAIGYKVPGLRHGQPGARGLSALVCESSVLFWALLVHHRFLPANRSRVGPSEIMLPWRWHSGPRSAVSQGGVPAVCGGVVLCVLISGFAVNRTKPNMNPPSAVPDITEADT
jgi:hypothetical protein